MKIKVKDGLWMFVSFTNDPTIDFHELDWDPTADRNCNWIGSWNPVTTEVETLTYNVKGVTCLRDAISHF